MLASPRRALLILAVLAAPGCKDIAPTDPALSRAGSMASTQAALDLVEGPVRFVRARGAPVREVRTLSTAGFEAPFELRVTSGDASGSHRVSSATVELDGGIVLGPSAFNQTRDSWTLSVAPAATAQLAVTLAGAPASYLEVSLYGNRTAAHFCRDGRPGSIPDLQQAIDATPAGGTVLVCDGEHAVKATINKPLTLRSENPDGAVLTDAEGSTTPPRPILRVDGVTQGLVRVTDIGIRVADYGIVPSGSFDQVQIDDVAFVGPGGGVFGNPNSVAVRVEASSVPTARVTVSDSRFELLNLGVWPVNRVETIVSGSSFDRFTGGGIVFSNDNSTTTQSFGRAEDNYLTNCGSGGCIRVLTAGAVTVARNTLVAGNQSTSLGAITVNASLRSTSASPAIVENNTITSAATGGSPSTPGGWRFAHGIQLIDPNGTKHVVRGNTITDAFTGITFGGSGDATDNRIIGGFRAFDHQATHGVRFQRNDATGQTVAFVVASAWGGQYQCNYWGGAAPSGMPVTVPAAAYTPFATAPIAGLATPCDPTSAFGVVRVCSSGAGGTVATLAEAVALLAPGGTVLLCDGTHAAPAVAVTRQMTIESEGPVGATLDAGSATHALIIGGIPGTPFVVSAVRGVRFTGGTDGNVLVNDLAGSLVFERSEFNPPATAPYGGPLGTRAGIDLPGIGVPMVTITNSRFVGGDVGFNVTNFSGTYVINGNDFNGQNNTAIRITSDNLATSAVLANRFRDCGPVTCVFTRRPISFLNNVVTVDIARPTATPLLVDNSTTSASAIQNNTFAGEGTGGADRSLPGTYPISGSAVQVRGPAVVRLNNIKNAYAGIAGSATALTGADNIIERTYTPFAALAPAAGSIVLQRNDLLDYIVPVMSPATFSTLDLRCNYWGSAAGPVNVPAGFEAAFTPISSVQIARTGALVVCTP